MSKLITGFLVFGLIIMLAVGIAQGGGGMQTETLTAPVTISETTQITVADTTGWLSADIVTIDSETLSYTSKDATHLKGLTRGIYQTNAATHKTGAFVYTQATSAINQGIGFNAASLAVTNGNLALITVPVRFLWTSIPSMIVSADGLFSGDLSIIQYFFLIIGIGVYIAIAIPLLSVAAYALRR